MLRVCLLALTAAACGSAAPAPPRPAPPPAAAAPAAPGLDYASYRKLTAAPFRSRVHGNRMVDVYANELSADAYLDDGAAIPVGSILVKVGTDGAVFVMEKKPAGFAPDHGDWYYALHWPSPPPEAQARFGKSVDWRTPSPRVDYCFDCHDSYDRQLGGLTPTSVLPR